MSRVVFDEETAQAVRDALDRSDFRYAMIDAQGMMLSDVVSFVMSILHERVMLGLLARAPRVEATIGKKDHVLRVRVAGEEVWIS